MWVETIGIGLVYDCQVWRKGDFDHRTVRGGCVVAGTYRTSGPCLLLSTMVRPVQIGTFDAVFYYGLRHSCSLYTVISNPTYIPHISYLFDIILSKIISLQSNPVVKGVMKDFAGRIDVVEVCTDDFAEIAAEAGVVSIPTIQLFYGGELIDTIVGCVAKNVLSKAVTKVLEETVGEELIEDEDGEAVDEDKDGDTKEP